MPLSIKHQRELERELGQELFKVIDNYRARLITEGEPDPDESFASVMVVFMTTMISGCVARGVPESAIHESINTVYSSAIKAMGEARATAHD